MSVAYTEYAKLDHGQATELQALEKDLGAWVVAIKPQAEVAPLTKEQLDRLQAAERKMGVILLAYNPAEKH